jgi:AraC-like DNA-binding protein
VTYHDNADTLSDKEEEKALRKKEAVSSLYRYSDLSIELIARQVGMSPIEVQQITNDLAKTFLLSFQTSKLLREQQFLEYLAKRHYGTLFFLFQ